MSDFAISIGGRNIGCRFPAYLIAEVGLGHDGSLGMAHRYIECAASSGVDAIKFQTHIASEESTLRESFRVDVFPQDNSRFDYWRRTEFTLSQWKGLAEHARDCGLEFLSSPFSNLAIEYLIECKVEAWKIASGEVGNFPLLESVVETKKPVLLSSGMSSWQELDETVGFVKERGCEVAVFQCTSAYPCPPQRWGLNLLSELSGRYQCPVGLSDHSGSVAPSIAAYMLGARLFEFHVTFSKKQFGPDVTASLTFEQVSELVRYLRDIELAMQNEVDKDSVAIELHSLRKMFTKSIVAKSDLIEGTLVDSTHLAFKKPGVGIPPADLALVIGKRLKRSVARDELILLEDLE